MWERRSFGAWAVFSGVITIASFAVEARGQCPTFLPGRQVGTVESEQITEASGIVASRKNTGVVWTHQDNGMDRRLFAMSLDGRNLGVWSLNVPATSDQEDIAIGPGPVAGVDYIYLGDTGQNNNDRATVRVIRAVEPTVSASQNPPVSAAIPAETITLKYPTSIASAPSHKDCETLLVDKNGDIYLVTKRTAVGMVYRAAYPQSTTNVVTMDLVGQLSWGGCTGGDISADGSQIVVRNYGYSMMWQRSTGVSIGSLLSTTGCVVTLMSEPQGEAICFAPGGSGFYTLREGSHPPIYYIPTTSACVANGNCDDGDPCTLDQCLAGSCQHTPVTVDTDHDGVMDCEDACPGTTYGTSVDSNGCSCPQLHPGDDDRDGVSNCNDRCANSPRNRNVDNNGCTVERQRVRVVRYRNGSNGYRSVYDTFIQQSAPEAVHGAEELMALSTDDQANYRNVGLIRFDDVFGTGEEQVPPGSAIVSATLTLVAFDSGDGTDAELHEVLVPWSEYEVTWNNFTGGPTSRAVTYDEGVAESVLATGVGTTEIDVTASVQTWALNPAYNMGWAFVSHSPAGLQVRSREYNVETERPELTIVFEEPEADANVGGEQGGADTSSTDLTDVTPASGLCGMGMSLSTFGAILGICSAKVTRSKRRRYRCN